MLQTQIMGWDAARAEAIPIRFRVFVEEQQVPVEMELDQHDAASLHVVARVGGRAVGTGRLLPVETHGELAVSHIGRMAVLGDSRGIGVGAAMLGALIGAARTRGDQEILLSAQIHAIGFYRGFGFAEENEIYMDADIPHQTMRLALARRPPSGA